MIEPNNAPKSASGTLRRGLSVSPAGTGTYSNPVQANSAASPPTFKAPKVETPAGGGAASRFQSTKKSPAALKSTIGISFAPLKKSLTSAPGLMPRQLSAASPTRPATASPTGGP